MKSNFLILILVVVSSYTLAQNATLSPYSYYGIGQPVPTRTAENNAMGGVTVYADSTQFSLDNPATLGKLRFVQYRIGANYNSTLQHSSSVTSSTATSSLNYLALSVPTKYFAFSFGLKPKSSTGYRITNTDELNGLEYQNIFEGTGGVNSTFLGLAANPIDGLSLGVSVLYNFGYNEKRFNEAIVGIQNSTQVITRSEFSGIHYAFGLHFNRNIFSDYTLQFSATITPKSSLESQNSKIISAISNGSTIVEQEQLDLDNMATTTNKLAAETSIGLGIGKSQHWFVGATYVTADQGITSPFENNLDANFVAASRISVGGFYIPKYDSFTNYLSRVVYRVGARWEHTGMEVKSRAVKDFGITFGIGLPMNVLSKVNIGVEIGQKGTTDAGLLKENYTNIMLGFSLSDVWFIKRKYD